MCAVLCTVLIVTNLWSHLTLHPPWTLHTPRARHATWELLAPSYVSSGHVWCHACRRSAVLVTTCSRSLSAGHLAFPLETHLAEAFQGCRLLAFDSCSACSLLLLPHHFLQDVGCWGSASASRPSHWPVQAGRRAASGLPCQGLLDLASLGASSCC